MITKKKQKIVARLILRYIVISEKTGIRQSVISEYECGKRPLTQTAAVKIGKALNTDPEKLLTTIKRQDKSGN